MIERKYSELTTLEGESFPCPNCGATITFDEPRTAWCDPCGFYLSIEDVEEGWTVNNGWDYQRSKGRRCNHLRCSCSYTADEYYCQPIQLPGIIANELSGELGDAKCWPDEALTEAADELTKALWLVRSEMLARRSSDGQKVAEVKGQKVAEAFHPGVYITEEMEARGWDMERLSAESGIPRLVIREIADGYIRVIQSVADGLAKAFGVDAQTWMNLQAMYDDHMNAKRAELWPC
jgi:plasmid maintenance system antidote protein VapI